MLSFVIKSFRTVIDNLCHFDWGNTIGHLQFCNSICTRRVGWFVFLPDHLELVVVEVDVDITSDTDTDIWDNEGAVEVGFENMAGGNITMMGEDGSLQGWRRGTCGRLHKGVSTVSKYFVNTIF